MVLLTQDNNKLPTCSTNNNNNNNNDNDNNNDVVSNGIRTKRPATTSSYGVGSTYFTTATNTTGGGSESSLRRKKTVASPRPPRQPKRPASSCSLSSLAGIKTTNNNNHINTTTSGSGIVHSNNNKSSNNTNAADKTKAKDDIDNKNADTTSPTPSITSVASDTTGTSDSGNTNSNNNNKSSNDNMNKSNNNTDGFLLLTTSSDRLHNTSRTNSTYDKMHVHALNRHTRSKSYDSSSSSVSLQITGNLMRSQHRRDPMKIFQVMEILGEGSMGSVARVRKLDAAVGGSARKEYVDQQSNQQDDTDDDDDDSPDKNKDFKCFGFHFFGIQLNGLTAICPAGLFGSVPSKFVLSPSNKQNNKKQQQQRQNATDLTTRASNASGSSADSTFQASAARPSFSPLPLITPYGSFNANYPATQQEPRPMPPIQHKHEHPPAPHEHPPAPPLLRTNPQQEQTHVTAQHFRTGSADSGMASTTSNSSESSFTHFKYIGPLESRPQEYVGAPLTTITSAAALASSSAAPSPSMTPGAPIRRIPNRSRTRSSPRGKSSKRALGEGRASILRTAGSMIQYHGPKKEVYYALKSIHLDRCSSPEYKQELRNEVEILKNLDHPNIVKAIETFDYKDRLFIVLELCSGGDLYSRDPYTEQQAQHILISLFSAISYLHSRGIVHRDIKFENIMFVNPTSDQVKLIDFGLSQKFAANEHLHDAVGTVYTMAPELLAGDYNAKADVWSLGVIAYMLLSSSMPFYGKDRVHVIRKIIKGKFHFSSRRWRYVSTGAKDFVKELLQVDPALRPSADKALKSQWLAREFDMFGIAPEIEMMDQMQATIQAFATYGTLKKLALIVIAYKSTTEEIGYLKNMFNRFDKDHSGEIDLREFKATLSEYYDYTDSELEAMFQAIDIDGTGLVHYSEFLAATIESHGSISEERIAEAFDRLDADGSGYITESDLKEFLGGNVNSQFIGSIIDEADITHDHRISYKDFKALWNNDADKVLRHCRDEVASRRVSQNNSVVSSTNSTSGFSTDDNSSEMSDVTGKLQAAADILAGKMKHSHQEGTISPLTPSKPKVSTSNFPSRRFAAQSAPPILIVSPEKRERRCSTYFNKQKGDTSNFHLGAELEAPNLFPQEKEEGSTIDVTGGAVAAPVAVPVTTGR